MDAEMIRIVYKILHKYINNINIKICINKNNSTQKCYDRYG